MKFKDNIIIGLEIHVELDTESKLFCSCATQPREYDKDRPNSRTCPTCLGMPGSKPYVNKKAIEHAIKLALALGCTLSDSVIFSRKSYFYPDLAKNYQITQYEEPLGRDGYVDMGMKKIGITRVHIEEDPAALIHPSGMASSNHVLIDYNRSGNPLCEIVTEPDIRSPEEARKFMDSLISILRYLGIFNPGKNIIKADANISIKESGYIRSEVKNITGFRDIELALEYEIERQKQAVREGKKLKQETRGWDSEKGITSLLRTKETEEDYGYIFDPDLVPITLERRWVSGIKKSIPELPYQKAKKYISKGIAEDDAYIIANDYSLAMIFEDIIQNTDPVLASRWVRRELSRVLNYHKKNLEEINIRKQHLIDLLSLIGSKKITDRIGKDILEMLVEKDFDVLSYVEKNNLQAVSDSTELERLCIEAIAENEKAVLDYKSGNNASLNFILGQVMRKSKGKADPNKAREILKKKLS